MPKIEIDKAELIELYANGSNKKRKLLTEIYGPEIFVVDITEVVTSYEAALKLAGPLTCSDKEALDAIGEMIIITRALNGGVDLTAAETWYQPVFTKTPLGFSLSYPGYWDTYTYVGSRLSFRKREHAEFAGRKFLDKYAKFIPALS